MLPAQIIEHEGYSGFANEVGPHNPDLRVRATCDPVVRWVGQFLEGDDRHPIANYHLDLYERLQNSNRICIEAPRSFAKTTIIRNFVLFLMYNYKDIKAGKFPGMYPFKKVRILSCSGPKAHEILAEIREVVESNPLLLGYYGNIKGSKWTEHLGILKTKDGFEVTAAGRGAQVRGFRPDLLICDDLDDDEEVLSDERMQKAFHWFDSAVFNTIDEDDYRVFVIGTVLEEISLLKYIGDKPSFERVVYDCYTTHDNPEDEGYELWPSKWSHDRLQERKEDIGFRSFAAEFRGKPQPSENPIFERHWFLPYDPESDGFQRLLQKGLYGVTSCDPAISKQDKSDYTALATLGATFEATPRIYLRTGGVKRGHWTLHRTVSEFYTQYVFFLAKMGIVEANAYQQALADEIEAYMESERAHMEIIALHVDKDKERRAHVVAPMVAKGQVFYDPNDPEHLALIDECVLFKPGYTNIKKDRMDAFVHGLTHLKEWSKRASVGSQAKRVLPGNRQPSQITGI